MGTKKATLEAKALSRPIPQAHRAKRKALAPAVAAGLYNCARCGERIEPGEPWDLGHSMAMVFATPALSIDAATVRRPATARSARCSSSSSGRGRENGERETWTSAGRPSSFRGGQAAFRRSRRPCPNTKRYGAPAMRPLARSVRVMTLVISPQPHAHGMPSPSGLSWPAAACALRSFAPA